jgi:hypothetical protein
MEIIDLYQRSFPAKLVRMCCTKIYGKPIYTNSWSAWRVWAKVEKRPGKRYTFEEFCRLAAIAYIRTVETKRELRYSQIQRKANTLQVQATIAKAVEYADAQGLVEGRHAVEALAQIGIKVTERSLYNNIPRFRRTAFYDIKYLKKLARA